MSNGKWEDKTVGGFEVRIYAEDGIHPYPIHGAVLSGGGWRQFLWTTEGKYAPTPNHALDLIPKKRVAYLLLNDACEVLGAAGNEENACRWSNLVTGRSFVKVEY